MLVNKWVQAALMGGFTMGLWIGSWIAGIFDPMVLFISAYLFVIPTLWMTLRAKGTKAP